MIEEERAHFSTRSFFYLETLDREGDSFSSDEDPSNLTSKLEGFIHGFKEEDSMNESIEEESIDE